MTPRKAAKAMTAALPAKVSVRRRSRGERKRGEEQRAAQTEAEADHSLDGMEGEAGRQRPW